MIARTADGTAIQNELLEHWESFDNLTYNQILVLSPNPLGKYEACVPITTSEGVGSTELSFNQLPSREWQNSFLKEIFSECDTSGHYAQERPGSLEKNKSAITSAATQTARFFGISEAWIPCIVVLSLQERTIFFITVDEVFSLYNFTRSILIKYEPTARNIETIIEKIKSLNLLINEKNKIFSNLLEVKTKIGQEWNIQKTSVCNLLSTISNEYNFLADNASFFIDCLNEKIEITPDIFGKIEKFLNNLANCITTEVDEQRILKKVTLKLPKAVKKLQQYQIIGINQECNLENQRLEKEILTTRIEIDNINSQLLYLKKLLKQTRTEGNFSNAICLAAINENFLVEEVDIHLPTCLRNWRAVWLRRQASSSQEVTSSLHNQLAPILRQMKKILILAANPEGTTPLRLDQEVREIDAGLQRAKHRDQFNLAQRWAVQPRDIQRAMLDINPQIVHFSGHGAGDEGLVFEDENGQVKLVSGEALAELFKLFADQIECVVLNGCYSQVQAEALAQHVNYVIGMKKEIGDRAAIEFAVGFYDAIGSGRPVEFAYKFGCAAIRLAGIPEQLTPVLKKKPNIDETVIKISLSEEQPATQEKVISVSPTTPIEVFFSYAHEDEELKDELVKHLSILKRQGVITDWHDREITAGTEWAAEIDTHLNTASVILLLISSDFLASDYCYDIELTRAMERHATREARVIPVILREVDWKGAVFGKLQSLPRNAEPITNWPNRDAAFADVVRGIRKVMEELRT